MSGGEIESWDDLELTDLFYAYRKAKADCFYERALYLSRNFVGFEADLPNNLSELLVRLKSGDIEGLLYENLGRPRLSAKKLSAKPDGLSEGVDEGHGYFSDPGRAFNYLTKTHQLSPEFRVVGDFPVVMHVLSALWINLVGHKFDGVLSRSSYGTRLRRYQAKPDPMGEGAGEYHLEGIGSFQQYIGPYRKWRENGLKAIREELSSDKAVIALTMDLTSYYHRIDPLFISDERFHSYAGVKLTQWEREFTSSFASALTKWSELARDMLLENGCRDANTGGLPIGLSVSKVMSNVLLVGLDREIEQQLSPVYYGRYVDDLFIVLRDPETIDSMPKILEYMHARTACFPIRATGDTGNEIYLKLPGDYQGHTTLLLQQSKQKVFFLQGKGGLDLLDSIESQIRMVSSERRLMPSPDKLEATAAAKVLTAAGLAAEEADTLRRADGLSVRRLGWAVLLRAVESLSRDLRQDDWEKERNRFYRFSIDHILRPDKIFDHLDYLPRLLSLAVAMMDWSNAKVLFESAISSLDRLREATKTSQVAINGYASEKYNHDVWVDIYEGVKWAAADTIIRSLRWGRGSGGLRTLPDTAVALCESVGLYLSIEELSELSQRIRECDWSKIPFKDHLRRNALRQPPFVSGEEVFAYCYPHYGEMREFLDKSSGINGMSTSRVHPRCVSEGKVYGVGLSMVPYLFPTRPYTAQDVSLFLPDECVFSGDGVDMKAPAKNWAKYVRALRGVWVWDYLVDNEVTNDTVLVENSQTPYTMAVLGSWSDSDPIRLGISSLLTTEASWKVSADGGVDLSRERYKRIERLVNQTIQAHPKPTHFLLPELSLPERWVNTVSSVLRGSGISLIAGLDYHSSKSSPSIHSEAVLVLEDNRLGFPAYVQIHQPKTMPAPSEEQSLIKDYGRYWTTFPHNVKPVYLHKGFSFGVLVCSELQNIEHRTHFQGAVDSLMVLSWNQDLETFSALVESSSLDVHAYIALVNNRMYGDGRVRVPAKEHYARDLCRIKGGKNEHVVVVEIDIKKLRAFQSRATRWPSGGDPYKPVPEGFSIEWYRRETPS